jgi:DNA-binding NarL/FixJ family response regulator
MKITVFIVDDHDVVRRGLRALLDPHADIAVIGEAETSRDAIEAIEKLNPDVAVLDVMMPGLGGIEAAERVHERCPGVRIIMFSAHSDAENIHRALRAGAAGYLSKLCAASELADAIRRVAAGKHYLSPGISETMLQSYAQAVQAKDPLEALSARERQVLRLLAEGRSISEIGTRLSVSPRTVETYRERMMEKLKLKDFRELLLFAVRHGVIPLK